MISRWSITLSSNSACFAVSQLAYSPAKKVIYIEITAAVFCLKVPVYNVLIHTGKDLDFPFFAHIRHFLNNTPDLIHADVWVRTSEFLLILPEITTEYSQSFIQSVRPRLIALFY